MRKVFLAVLAAAVLLCASSCAAKTETQSYAMDTFLTQELYGDSSEKAAKLNEETVLAIENAVSAYLPASDICALNDTGERELGGISAELFGLAMEAAEKTDGAFNPAMGTVIDLWNIDGGNTTVPSDEAIRLALGKTDLSLISYDNGKAALNGARLDLGGITKGYALDRMAENCRGLGVESGLIDFGGSIAAIGEKPDGGKWTVGIKDPLSEAYVIATVRISDAFVSTSGVYERYFESGGKIYHHIFDTATGRPADNGLAGVSVISGSGILTDEMSTALFVMGPEKGPAYADKNGIAAVFIKTDGTVITAGPVEDYRFEEYSR